MIDGQKIIDVAQKELGYCENPPNSNETKYGKWYGLDSVPWCAIFVSWCYHSAGYILPKIDSIKGYCSCQNAFIFFKKNNQITKNPVAGDIVLFDWDLNGKFEHTGLFVRKIDNDTFESIEGNTSFGNDSNGGIVMLRRRKFFQSVFVHLEN